MSTETPDAKPKSQARSIVAFSSLIMLIFCVVVGYQAARSYQQALRTGEEESALLTQSLSNHVELKLLAADLILKRAVERQYFNQLFGQALKQDIENNFRLWVQEIPQIDGLFMADAGGRVQLGASTEKLAGIFDLNTSVARANFFTEALNKADQEQAITLFSNRGDDTAFIIIARAIYTTGGDFGGVVFAVIDPEYFNRFFKSVETGTKSYMTMIHANGQVLVSGAGREAEEVAVTEEILSRTNIASLAADAVTTRQTRLDNTLKIYSFLRLHDLPVVVAVVTDEQDFLAAWRSDRRKDVGFLAMFAIFGCILSYFALTMVKQIKRVEESESTAVLASQAKSEFLANMSHELRTPLNAIIGFSEMLNAGYFGKLAPKQKERIHDIHMCGNHLLQLINDILEFSKGEAGKMDLHEEEIDIGSVISECVRMMAPRARNKAVEMESRLEPGLPFVFGDKRKLRQLLLNLLSNAVKFTEEGGRITVAAQRDASGGLELLVNDTGIGMSEADIPVALSVFGQVHRASHPEGTGLGLPLCIMFAELHDGRLKMDSQRGVGTTVTVSFPPSRLQGQVKEKVLVAG